MKSPKQKRNKSPKKTKKSSRKSPTKYQHKSVTDGRKQQGNFVNDVKQLAPKCSIL